MKVKLLLLVFVMSTGFAMSQSKSLWQKQTINNNLRVKPGKQSLPKSQIFTLNIESLRQALENSPQIGKSSSLILSFPNAEGEFERFRIFETSVMNSELASRYPEIKSYAGQGIDDPTAIIRFSVTPLGFQSMRLSANKPASFIEALTDDASIYSVYTRANRINYNNEFECSVTESMNKTLNAPNVAFRNADDGILRTYRLAVSATGEYTNFHGGTKADALAAIVQTMTRVNGIFEIDFNVNMTLIGNTDDVIYTNTATDPYGNTTANYNSELQSTLTSVIGEANYDIGHLFANLQNNGNAGCIGCVCVNNQKGSGWTSASVPEGEFFDVDYVAHEMGHQFGANHTWTFNGNEGTNVQMEPGSGTTIMSYAGITGATDVESNVTPNFHAASIEQVTDYIKSTSCQTETITGNAVPEVNAGSDYTIPKGTAFVLDGSATDASIPANTLSFCWEQMDENNASSTYPSVNATTGVAFRAYEPTTDTHRYFPRLETIKTGATSWQWEAVPNVARALNFRLTVRDNVAGGGTNSSDDVVVTVNGTAGPFVVNSPNTNVTWNAGSSQTITWDVAGTTGNGINAANVDIFLSTDGGDTYPVTVALGVTNDGSHDIVVPNNQGNQNRIMVRGANHIFFDISNTDFTISAPASCTANIPIGLAASNISLTSATLSWEAVPGASYSLRYREVGLPSWTTVAETGISYNITGLIPSTQYETQIRSECSGGSNSAYSNIVNFTTLSDTEAPVIFLTGDASIDLFVGNTYNELGATATDNIDGDLTPNILIGGDVVDTNTLGTYTITYNVSDAAGNPAVEVTRTVNVILATYCDSNGNNTNDEYINRVQLNTLDNNNSGVGTTSTGYSDFTSNPALVANLFAGNQYTITITPLWTGTIYPEGYAVWIDYNQNGDFNDPGELVFSQAPTQATPVSGSFTLPSPTEVSYGETRMRVSLKYDGIPIECESFSFGEVEDYTINVKYNGLLFSGGNWDPSAPNGTTTADNILILDGANNSISDISINNLIVNTGATLNIDQTSNITVGGDIDVMSNGDLILNSSSTEFSSLIVDGTVSGTVTYNRHVTSNANGNDLIAPPVSGESFTSFISNNSNVFANSGQTMYLFGPFEKPANTYGLFSNVEAATLDAGNGYRAASTDDGTFTFSGAVTTGSLSVPIEKTGTDYDKWNLIGNPYTSYIKLEDFLQTNLNELDPNTVAIYGYDADLTFGTEWTIWNMAYSDNNPNSLIAPGQGFFVSSKDGGANVTFNPSMRSTGISDDFIAGRTTNLSHFVITMTSTQTTYNTDLYFEENATLGLDIAYDAELFAETPSAYSIYSELTEADQDLNMAIQTIGYDDVNGTTLIPIGINLPQGQQVSIGMETNDLTYNVYFEDTLTNTITLLNTSDYNLTADTDLLGTGRFFIRFETETLSVTESSLDAIQIYSDTNLKQIVVKGQVLEETSFVLYDIQGREIIRTDLDTATNKNVIDASNYANGVYLVQLTNKSNTISRKVVIK